MHPLIARYLNAPALIEVLEKADQAVALSPDEAAMAAAATAHPSSKAAVLKSKGRETLSNDAQQHMLRIIVDAALRRVSADHELGPKVRAATAALTKEGASEEEAHHLLLQAVLDEAFGWAEDPTSFDARFLGETLDGLVALAAVTSDSVDDCMEAFAKAGGENRALRYTVAEALMESAWGEGPEPVT
ncbi:MAG: hypothetical protein JNG84_12645, partial [Archangium sp.]|nr:hypothetical protein [Archangium sp.]